MEGATDAMRDSGAADSDDDDDDNRAVRKRQRDRFLTPFLNGARRTAADGKRQTPDRRRDLLRATDARIRFADRSGEEMGTEANPKRMNAEVELYR